MISFGLSYLKLSDHLVGRSYKVTICVFSQFGRILILILLVPDHGLPFTLVKTKLFQICKFNTHKQVQNIIILKPSSNRSFFKLSFLTKL